MVEAPLKNGIIWDALADVLAKTRPDRLLAELYMKFCDPEDLKHLMTEASQVVSLEIHFMLAPGAYWLVPRIIVRARPPCQT